MNSLTKLLCTLSSSFLALAAAAATYKEQAGVVLVEAEHFDARTANADGHRWQIVPDENGNPNTPADGGFTNARGGKYMQSQPDSAGGGANYNTLAQVGGDPHLDFKVQISNPGIYRLWLRWGGYDGSSDSMYAQILELKSPAGPGPDWYRYVGNINLDFDAANAWNGSGAPSTDAANNVGGGGGEVPALFNIAAAGTYTIRLSMREDGSAVDAVMLQLASLPNPTGQGPAESLTTTGADTTPPVLREAKTAGNPSGVVLVFNEEVAAASALDKNNYTVNNGVTVSSVSMGQNNYTVVLSTTPIAAGQLYTVTVNGVKDPAGNSIAANTKATFYQVDGFIQRRAFYVSGGTVAAITNSTKFTQNKPDEVTYPTQFEGPVDYMDNYGTQIRGYVTPPTTGAYIFFICSDDPSILFLSTDDNPANKKLIAAETGWSTSRNWQGANGGDATAKRSDTYTGSEWPTPNAITLTAGKRYYIEAIHAEAGGGDNIAVTWMKPGDAEPANGDPPIQGTYLSAFGITNGPVTIATQPANATAFEPVPATFTVTPSGSPPYSYQWFKNGVAIIGATAQSYTTPATKVSDSGSKFSVQVSNPFSSATSSNATLSVISDTTPPVLYRAVGSPTFNKVTLVFSEAVSAASTNLANFSISGLTITGASLENGGTNIVLATSQQTAGTVYNVTVKDVKDFGPNLVLSPNPTTTKFTGFVLTPGGILHKYWSNITANNIAGLTNDTRFPNNPSFTSVEPAAEYPPGGGNEAGSNYGNQLTGFVKAPATGDYVFFLCSDDPSVLFLSTDENPANKKLIAQETSWSSARRWVTSDGPSDLSAKRSDQYTGSEWPTPNVIHLTAGKLYYIEALHTEGGGGDNVGITWMLPGGAEPTDGQLPIQGSNLVTYANPDVSTASIAISAPANNAVLSPGVIALSATTTDTNGPIRAVEFFANGTSIGKTTTSPFTISWTNSVAGRYILTANALDRLGYTVSSPPVVITVGNAKPEALLVIGTVSVPTLNAADAAAKARLEGLGFNVTVIDAPGSTTADASGKSLIVTSATVNSGDVGNKFQNVPVPVLDWEQALQDNYLMTLDGANDHNTTAGLSDIDILNSTHPLAAGLTGTVTILTAPETFSWGLPLDSAIKIAQVANDPTKYVLYAYDTGAALVGGVKAPARRVLIFLSNDTFPLLNENGLKLFDAAVKWAANLPTTGPAPQFNKPTLSGKNMTISWTGAGTLQQADSITGPWTDAASQANPQTITASAAKRFYRIK